MNNLTTFYIVRHGETEWNLKKLLQGQTDIPLNENGEKQAEKLAQELKNVYFDEIISSDLVRAKRTAEIIAIERELAVSASKALREKTYGELEGKSWEETSKLYDEWKTLSEEQRWTYTVAKGEETNQQAYQRFITFLRETAIVNPNKNILVVCHGGLIRLLLIRLGIGDFESIRAIENCGFAHLESDGVDFFVKKVSGIIGDKEFNDKN